LEGFQKVDLIWDVSAKFVSVQRALDKRKTEVSTILFYRILIKGFISQLREMLRSDSKSILAPTLYSTLEEDTQISRLRGEPRAQSSSRVQGTQRNNYGYVEEFFF
jgi:hypothetical protein